MYQWDDYSATAPHSSDDWATTDRGWCVELLSDGRVSYGNYLDYADDYYRSKHGGCVHAVRFTPVPHIGHSGVLLSWSTLNTESRWFATVTEAKAWISERAELGMFTPQAG